MDEFEVKSSMKEQNDFRTNAIRMDSLTEVYSSSDSEESSPGLIRRYRRRVYQPSFNHEYAVVRRSSPQLYLEEISAFTNANHKIMGDLRYSRTEGKEGSASSAMVDSEMVRREVRKYTFEDDNFNMRAPSREGAIKEEGKEWRGLDFTGEKSLSGHINWPFDLTFNPIVCLLLIFWIIGFIWVSFACPQNWYSDSQQQITKSTLWFLVTTSNIWVGYVIWIFFSKFDVVMGIPGNDNVEYNRMTWYNIIVISSLVSESFSHPVVATVKHYNHNHLGNTQYNYNHGELSKANTLFFVGFHSRAMPCLFAILLCILHYRDQIPITFKSTLYPIMKDSIYGWIGDLIDFLTIVVTICSVTVHMANGVRAISTFMRVDGYSFEESRAGNDFLILEVSLIIPIIVASSSLYSHFKFVAIKYLSFLGSFFSCLILIQVVFSTTFSEIALSSLEAVGYYLAYFIPMGVKAETFLLHTKVTFDKIDQVAVRSTHDTDNYLSDHQRAWSMLECGWCWARTAQLGMFFAKISKGRTVQEMIVAIMLIPTIVELIWCAAIATSAIKVQKDAYKHNLCCNDDPHPGNHMLKLKEFLRAMNDRVARSDHPDPTSDHWVCGCASKAGCQCNNCTLKILQDYQNQTYYDLAMDLYRLGDRLGAVIEDQNMQIQKVRLSCVNNDSMWYFMTNALSVFSPITMALEVMAIATTAMINHCISMYVLSSMASNGLCQQTDNDTAYIYIWSFISSSFAILSAFDRTHWKVTMVHDSLAATITILGGLFFSGVLLVASTCVLKTLRIVVMKHDPFERPFVIGLFDAWFAEPYYLMKDGYKFYFKLLCSFTLNIITAPYTINKALNRVKPDLGPWVGVLLYGTYIGSVVSMVMLIIKLFMTYEIQFEARMIFICFFCPWVVAVAWSRYQVRTTFELSGNVLEDLLASIFYANVSVQLDVTTAQAFDVSQMIQEKFEKAEIDRFDMLRKKDQSLTRTSINPSNSSFLGGEASKNPSSSRYASSGISEGMEVTIIKSKEG